MIEIPSSLTTILAITVIAYVAVMFGISLWARGQVHDTEDFLVAGRRLPLLLAWPTLLATWFGAGTLLTATDEVRAQGLRAGALEPFGTGFCLIVAGLFFARPLWNMKLLTLCDFYRRRFGFKTEIISAMCMVPGYFGWIAAQFVAVAGMLEIFFDIPLALGILLTAAVGAGYTLLGGMWSVTLTDALQMALIVIGLFVLTAVCMSQLGDGSVADGLTRLFNETPPDKRVLIPTEDLAAFVGWMGVFCVGVFGNLPGQDLMQRVFAAKSAKTAMWACHLAGISYVTVGLLPLSLGLAGGILLPDAAETAIVPLLAQLFLSPLMAVIFIVALMSAVLSTIDSAILSPASVLAENLLAHIPRQPYDHLQLNRFAVVFITVMSVIVALLGESAYALLEVAYEIGLVALLVPLVMGMRREHGSEVAAIGSMVAGTSLWGFHLLIGWEAFLAPVLAPIELPVALSCAVVGFAYYLVAERFVLDRGEGSP